MNDIMTVKQHDKEPSKQMNIDEAKTLLNTKGITFEEKDYATQREYWEHCSEFWHFEYASTKPDSMRKVLVIPCANGKKDIELKFKQENGEFILVDLLFGSFAFEIVEIPAKGKTIEEDLEEHISDLLENKYAVLTVNRVGHGVIADSCRPNPGKEEKAKLIEAYGRAYGFLGKLLKRKYIVELYDRDLYETVGFNELDRAKKTEAVRKWWDCYYKGE